MFGSARFTAPRDWLKFGGAPATVSVTAFLIGASDIDTAVTDSLKALDPYQPLERRTSRVVAREPRRSYCTSFTPGGVQLPSRTSAFGQ